MIIIDLDLKKEEIEQELQQKLSGYYCNYGLIQSKYFLARWFSSPIATYKISETCKVLFECKSHKIAIFLDEKFPESEITIVKRFYDEKYSGCD